MRATTAAFIFALGAMLLAAHARSADGPTVQLREVSPGIAGRRVPMWLAMFDPREFAVVLIDNAAGNKARYATLPDALAASGCVAGCNASFFNRDPFDPVGLMICDGKTIHPVNRTNWMKGLLVVRGTQVALEHTDAFHASPDITAAIQSGPRLVWDGQIVSGLDPRVSARRTFVCHDGAGRWALGASEPCSLEDLAKHLRDPAVTALLNTKFAVNLDGGPSSGLWVAASPAPFYFKEGWPVRNYLGLKPR